MLCLLIFSALCVPFLLSQQDKVTVIVDKAVIYAEASENSYPIDQAKMGTVLTLFDPWKGEKTWLYVIFRSERWKGEVTGFIKSSSVKRGETIPEDLLKSIASEAEAKEPGIKEEAEQEKDELPSLKGVFETEGKKEETEKAIQVEQLSEEKPRGVEEPTEEPVREEKTEEKTIEPEIIPVKTKILSAKSEIPQQREVVGSEDVMNESRTFAVIREEAPSLEIREKEVKAVTEAQTAEETEVEVKPYEIKSEEPEPEVIKEHIAELKPPEETKEEAAAPTKPEVKEIEKPEKVKQPETAEKERSEPEAQPEIKLQREVKKPRLKIEAKEESPVEQDIFPGQRRKQPPELIRQDLPVTQRKGPLTMGFGFGPSFGGLGAFLQLNTKSHFSIHAGAGYYPANYYYSEFDWLKNQVLFSAGIKYYLPLKGDKLRTYLNLQYGGLTVEAVQVPVSMYEGVVSFENIQKNLYGVSFLGGLELRLGLMGINGSLGISYNTTEWEYWDRDLFLNGDVALTVYF